MGPPGPFLPKPYALMRMLVTPALRVLAADILPQLREMPPEPAPPRTKPLLLTTMVRIPSPAMPQLLEMMVLPSLPSEPPWLLPLSTWPENSIDILFVSLKGHINSMTNKLLI